MTSPMERSMNPVQHDAFELWFSLGEYITRKNKYKIIAKTVNVKPITVESWARRFKWNELVKLRNADVEDAIKIQTNNAVVTARLKFLDLARASLDDYAKRIEKEGAIPIKTTADLDRMIRLCLLLIGEATNRTEMVKPEEVREEAKKRAKEYKDYFDELERESQTNDEPEISGYTTPPETDK